MGSSKSDEPVGTWNAGSSLYSGRVDPTWRVPPDHATSLLQCIQQLRPAGDADSPEPPGLGYRGSWLRAPDGRVWQLFGGAVKAAHEKRRTHLLDSDRNCERELLQTAPAGVLPPAFL